MATGSSNIKKTEDNQALTHRCLNLIINVGGRVYRHILDNEIKYRNTTLSAYLTKNKTEIINTVPYEKQFFVLFPDGEIGSETADTFDISLMAYLLKQFFIKNGNYLLVGNYSTKNFTKAQRSFNYITVYDERAWHWSMKSKMFPWNTSVIADIVRIREYRNMIHELAHTKTWLTEEQFKELWNDLSAVLLNLGRAFGISNLYFDIQNALHDPLDIQRENDLMKSLGSVKNEQANQLEMLKTVNENVDKTWRTVAREKAEHAKDMVAIKKSQKQIEDELKSQAGKLKGIEETVNQNELRKKQEQVDKQEHDNLAECSAREMVMRKNSISDEVYVKTKAYDIASTRLAENNIVILCGNHGEGKTTMALKLISEHSVKGYRILKTPDDWRSVICNSCDVIFIDDIFGVAVVAEDDVKRWQSYFGDIQQAIKKGDMYAIMSIKHHILQKAKKSLMSRYRDLFDDENIVTIKSAGVSNEERYDILSNHLKANGREVKQNTLNSCLIKYTDDCSVMFPIGFPQCANLFCKIPKCYEQGYKFFREPIHFVKECLVDILNERSTYVAFFLLWAEPKQSLQRTDFEEEGPDNVLIKRFGISSSSNIVDTLHSHKAGFIDYHEDTERFQFSHNVIADVVGLIVCEKNIKDGIDFCSDDFLMMYMTTKRADTNTTEKVTIKESRYRQLCERLIQLNRLNKNVLLHDAFENEKFIAELAKEKDRTVEIFRAACVKGISSLVKRLLQCSVDYKMCDNDGRCPIHMSAFLGHSDVVKILLDHDRAQLELRLDAEQSRGKYKGASLMHIAVLRNFDNLLKELLNFGADLTTRDHAGKTPLLLSIGECPDIKISKILLKRKGDQIEMSDDNGTTPLSEAIRKEKIDIVKKLCNLVKDLNCKNNEGQTLLDIAIGNGNKEIVSLLQKKGAKSAAELEKLDVATQGTAEVP